MLESNLEAGSQKIPADLSQLRYGVSVTDGCIDWESTESLLLDIAARAAPCAEGTGTTIIRGLAVGLVSYYPAPSEAATQCCDGSSAVSRPNSLPLRVMSGGFSTAAWSPPDRVARPDWLSARWLSRALVSSGCERVHPRPGRGGLTSHREGYRVQQSASRGPLAGPTMRSELLR